MAPRLHLAADMKRLIPLALVILSGCGGDHVPTPASLTTPDPTYLFDTDNGPSSQHVFAITNQGEQATEPLTTLLSGDTMQFQIVDDQCKDTSLAGGRSCMITVQLSSAVAANYAAQLHMTAAGVALDIDMSGRVSPATLTVKAPSQPALVEAGGTTTATVTVTNGGGATLPSAIVLADGAISFGTSTIVNDHCSGVTLAGGASCTFDLSLTAAFDAGGVGTNPVTVSDGQGDATTALVAFTIAPLPPIVVTDGDFGVEDPTAPNIKTITVGNTTKTTSGVLSIGLGGPDPSNPLFPFVFVPGMDGCNGVALAPLASCTIALSVDPTASAPKLWTGSVLAVVPAGGTAVSVPLQLQTTVGHVVVTMNAVGTAGHVQTPWGNLCNGTDPACGTVNVGLGFTTTFTAVPDGANSVFDFWNDGPCVGSSNPVCAWLPPAGVVSPFNWSAEFKPK